jgi:hypothetical protein
MNIPGFSAEAVLPASVATRQSYSQCIADCQDACGADITCTKSCRQHCSGGGGSGGVGGGGSSQTNCDLCQAGCYLWLAVCEADYAVTTGGLGTLVSILTNELGGIGVDPCVYVKNQCLAACAC